MLLIVLLLMPLHITDNLICTTPSSETVHWLCKTFYKVYWKCFHSAFMPPAYLGTLCVWVNIFVN